MKMPRTAQEYEEMAEWVRLHRVIACDECGEAFVWQKHRGRPPVVCSHECLLDRQREGARIRVRKWRKAHA